jgi:CRP/FNR family transcriptional regulator
MAATPFPWWHAVPALKAINDPRWHTLMERAQIVDIPAGTTVFRAGEQCRNYLFVLDGTVRVEKIADNGREIVLYRVQSSETCVLTTSCLVANEHYPAEGITETAVRAVTLPAPVFHDALALSDEFRAFVFTSFGERIAELMSLVEAVALRRGDVRLAERLIELGDESGVVASTHHELAAELGTAREVVSRLLKEFERQGVVHLGRGRIEISDRPALKRLAAADR